MRNKIIKFAGMLLIALYSSCVVYEPVPAPGHPHHRHIVWKNPHKKVIITSENLADSIHQDSIVPVEPENNGGLK